jgi:hypothetical protein
MLSGLQHFVPITWMCKKQGAVSHSSIEVEIIALEAAMRMEGIPCLELWEEFVEVFSEIPNTPRTNESTSHIRKSVNVRTTRINMNLPPLPGPKIHQILNTEASHLRKLIVPVTTRTRDRPAFVEAVDTTRDRGNAAKAWTEKTSRTRAA